MSFRLCLLLLALASAPLGAASQDEDRDRARSMRNEARALRAEANRAFEVAEPECYQRFLVKRCLSQARDERLARIRAARALDIEASRLELEVKRREAAASGLAEPATAPQR